MSSAASASPSPSASKNYDKVTSNLFKRIYDVFFALNIVNFIVFCYLLARYTSNDTSISKDSMIAFVIMLLLFWSVGLYIYARIRYGLWANPHSVRDGQSVDQRYKDIMDAAQRGYVQWLSQADMAASATARTSGRNDIPEDDEVQEMT